MSAFCFQSTTIPALSHKPTAWRFLLILATSFTSLFSFFELVIIALLESRQSLWAAVTLLVYITFSTKCVKCQTQNIVIILLNYICKWDFTVNVWGASKNLDAYPPKIWTELNLLCSGSLQNKLTHFLYCSWNRNYLISIIHDKYFWYCQVKLPFSMYIQYYDHSFVTLEVVLCQWILCNCLQVLCFNYCCIKSNSRLTEVISVESMHTR